MSNWPTDLFCVSIRFVNERAAVILGLVGLFPQIVIPATLLHLLGWHGWIDWLQERLRL